MKKTQLRALKSDNKFKNFIINYFLNYGNRDEIKKHIEDIIKNGSNNGSVSFLIYHKDTNKLFTRYQNEILDILRKYESSTGERIGIQENFTDWAVRFAFESVVIKLHNFY